MEKNIEYYKRELDKANVKIELLEKQLETIHASIASNFPNLSLLERRVFLAIWNRKEVSTDQLLLSVYYDRKEPKCAEELISVLVRRLRLKLQIHRINIRHSSGAGYYFDKESIKIIENSKRIS